MMKTMDILVTKSAAASPAADAETSSRRHQSRSLGAFSDDDEDIPITPARSVRPPPLGTSVPTASMIKPPATVGRRPLERNASFGTPGSVGTVGVSRNNTGRSIPPPVLPRIRPGQMLKKQSYSIGSYSDDDLDRSASPPPRTGATSVLSSSLSGPTRIKTAGRHLTTIVVNNNDGKISTMPSPPVHATPPPVLPRSVFFKPKGNDREQRDQRARSMAILSSSSDTLDDLGPGSNRATPTPTFSNSERSDDLTTTTSGIAIGSSSSGDEAESSTSPPCSPPTTCDYIREHSPLAIDDDRAVPLPPSSPVPTASSALVTCAACGASAACVLPPQNSSLTTGTTDLLALSKDKPSQSPPPPAKPEPYVPPEPPATLAAARAFKVGTMARTRISDNHGRRVRKNWTSSLLALSDDYLILFKESKALPNNSNKTELTISLAGSTVDWSPEKSSRKNVFRLTAQSGHQLLLQDRCPLTCKEWFDAIRAAANKLPVPDPTSNQTGGPITAGASSGSRDSLDNCHSATKNGSDKVKRSKSQKLFNGSDKKEPLKSASSQEDILGQPITATVRRKRITERLRQFLTRRPTLESLRDKGIYKDEPVFGCLLPNLCARDRASVPKFVTQTIEAIEKKDLKSDGIYRVCGNLSQVQKIRFQVNQDNYTGLFAEEDVHVLTGLLKMFFRDMREPLFPCSLFDSLMKAIGQPDKKSKLEAFQKLIAELAAPNRETLRILLEHLLRVKQYSDENRMHIQNLAIVFGPTLMWPERETNNFAYDMMLRMHQNQIIEFLLLEFQQLFPPATNQKK